LIRQIRDSPGFRHKSASLLLDLLFGFGGFFNRHIVKFFGIEDVATFQAFNEFRVFLSGDNADPWVFAGGNHRFWQVWIWKLLPQIVASFSTISNGILVNLQGTLLGKQNGLQSNPCAGGERGGG
jgi:hypothetical protein